MIDTIYNPEETLWLQSCREQGAKTIGGLDMFIGQGIASINIWLKKNIINDINIQLIKNVIKSKLC
jgi:shikimate 5-dehydrogenase